jgi:hypothetical protein
MTDRSGGAPVLLMLISLLLAGCGAEDPIDPVPVNAECIQIHGEGQTVGHQRALAGHAVFTFDGEEREAQVGVYLNDLVDLDDDRKRVNIVYQFWWSNGDMILTENDVILSPLFEENRYEFRAELYVKSALGIFDGLEGESVLTFDAELFFSPSPSGADWGSVEEHFTVGGTVCVG